jgi:hypothetical protein
MSREHVELVAARLRTFQATLRATETTAPDFVCEMRTLEGWPDAPEYIGPDGFNEFFARWTDAYDEFEQRIEDVIDAGDEHVVSIICQRGRPRGSDSWVDLRFGIVFTVTKGTSGVHECSAPPRKPSKSWGCRSRRCRKRTQRGSRLRSAGSTRGIATTSTHSSRYGTQIAHGARRFRAALKVSAPSTSVERGSHERGAASERSGRSIGLIPTTRRSSAND